jgi:Transmembrane secretion effector
LLRKLVRTSESTVGDEREPADGLYGESAKMITGEGWISAGPGYRRHVIDGRLHFDIFLFALPGGAIGAIGDIVDRRKLILYTEAWIVCVAVALAGATIAGLMTP